MYFLPSGEMSHFQARSGMIVCPSWGRGGSACRTSGSARRCWPPCPTGARRSGRGRCGRRSAASRRAWRRGHGTGSPAPPRWTGGTPARCRRRRRRPRWSSGTSGGSPCSCGDLDGTESAMAFPSFGVCTAGRWIRTWGVSARKIHEAAGTWQAASRRRSGPSGCPDLAHPPVPRWPRRWPSRPSPTAAPGGGRARPGSRPPGSGSPRPPPPGRSPRRRARPPARRSPRPAAGSRTSRC